MTTPKQVPQQARAIIHLVAKGEKTTTINYSRRMYAIIRRYTPEAAVGVANECYAELTGLRTFFKKSYAELAQSIVKDLKNEIGISFTVRVAKAVEFDAVRAHTKKVKQISTYKELNTLFKGASFVPHEDRTSIRRTLRARRIRLSVPYLGKVK